MGDVCRRPHRKNLLRKPACTLLSTLDFPALGKQQQQGLQSGSSTSAPLLVFLFFAACFWRTLRSTALKAAPSAVVWVTASPTVPRSTKLRARKPGRRETCSRTPAATEETGSSLLSAAAAAVPLMIGLAELVVLVAAVYRCCCC